MPRERKNHVRKVYMLPASLAKNVEAFQSAQNLSSEVEAVRMLLDAALSNDSPTPSASIAPFGLRMQPSLKQRVEDSASANNRSINSEIVARLSVEDENHRDWFAGVALQGLLASPIDRPAAAIEVHTEHYATLAYLYADAMVAARKADDA